MDPHIRNIVCCNAISPPFMSRFMNNNIIKYISSARQIARLSKNDISGALSDFSKAIIINPGNFNLIEKRANLRAATKDYKAAIEDYSKILELTPNSFKILLARAELLILIGKKEQACMDYRKAEALGNGAALSKIIFYCN